MRVIGREERLARLGSSVLLLLRIRALDSTHQQSGKTN
jgi:hypothetical protein